MNRIGLAVLVVVGSAFAAEYPPDDSLMKGIEPEVPAAFREGRATRDEIESWSRSLIQSDVQLLSRNIDCDDADEILAEIPFARGSTGNREFLAFDRGERGYRYVGTVARVLRAFSFPGECYVVQYGSVGGGTLSLSLHRAEEGTWSAVGGATLKAGDLGTEEDRALFEWLKSGEPSREELLKVFR